MKSVEENIELLSRTILSEAQAEAEKIKAEAHARAEEIRKKAQEQAEAERLAILEKARQEAQRLYGQSVATTQMKARTMQLEQREKLLEDVFSAAQKRLFTVQQWSDYRQISHRLLAEAVSKLNASEIRVRVDHTTKESLTTEVLNTLSNERKVQLQMGEMLNGEMGVVVETADGHIHYDNTLETRLSRLQSALRSPVYHLLMGEML